MSELKEKLLTYGADVEGTMERFLDDEELYESCLDIFLEDEGYDKLTEAIENKNYTAAFDAAHTLKGVAGNLGLTPLYDAICAIVEPLRSQDYSNLDSQLQDVMKARQQVEALFGK